MIGYTRYYNVAGLPIGIETDFDLWVHYEHGDPNNDWVKISYKRKDIVDDGYYNVRIKKGIIIELDWA